MKNYAVDDGIGNRLTAGLQEQIARRVAQRIANERGESVYLYQTGDGEEAAYAEEIKPQKED
jgi:tRNA(Ile2) C34 agmatinyltransferase TiaS